jgi:hypothetical protein
MVNIETFMLGLLVVSTLTGLVTEAIKKILSERGITYYANTLAGVVATVLSAAIGVGYVFLTGVGFTAQTIVYIIMMVFISWLCSMVGYDKVIQAIKQFRTDGKDDKNE